MVTNSIQERLFALQDTEYRDFQSKLIPNQNQIRFIGVRTPALRALAKELSGTEEGERFLSALPHEYFDENNLHAFMLEQIKDYDKCMAAIGAFLPYVDNWATCDQMSPKVFRKHLPELLEEIKVWVRSKENYTCRFGMKMLMQFYLDDAFCRNIWRWWAKCGRKNTTSI